MKISTKRTAIVALCAIVLVVGVIILFFWNPSTQPFLPCTFTVLTGWYCPGCGTTRAMHALAHGQVYQAFRFNPILIVMLPLLLYLLLDELGPWWLGRRLVPHVTLPKWLILGFAVLIIVYTVLRNVPLSMFEWLRPTLLSGT